MVLTYNFLRSNSWDHAPLFPSYNYNGKGYSWMDPAYSWNKQLTHTPFPKKINTPITTLRFIGFVAKISVLNPKLPAKGQWPKERKESVTFFIKSPLILINRLKNRPEFFFYHFAPLFCLFFSFFEIESYSRVWTTPWLLQDLIKRVSFGLRGERMKARLYANSSSANQLFP